MVKIQADNGKVEDKDQEFFSDKNFDIVCALTNNNEHLKRVNSFCRNGNVMFLSGFVYGLFGYMFVDFSEFQYIV